MNTFDVESIVSNIVSNEIQRVKSNMVYDGFGSQVNSIEKVLYNLLYDDIQEDITEKYEPIYQCFCSAYSEAYLKGSTFYVGQILEDWWIEETTNCKEKLLKWVDLKEILDKFVTDSD